ncbi:MAG: PAS domain-containing protein [Alphaproteobacteria bacterium]|nr:PAS domain-containing protein [Alphaproteobacteria bacterium]
MSGSTAGSGSVVLTKGRELELDFARSVLQGVPAVIYVYDVKARKSIFQNRQLADLVGHAAVSDPNVSEWQNLTHPEDAATFPGYREQLATIMPGEIMAWEFRLRAPDGSWRWFVSRDALLSSDADGKPHLIVGNAFDISQQKDAERQKDLLAGEMRHRSRNFAAVVAALAEQSRPRDDSDAREAFDTFTRRVRTLLDTGNILLESDAREAALSNLVRTAIHPVQPNLRRIHVSGPEVIVEERAAAAIALVMHELTTNAIKYGALSNATGSVDLSWTCEQDGPEARVRMRWKESGGPAVEAPTREGFGTRLLRSAVPGGRVELRHAPDGLQFELLFPPNKG